MRLAPRSFRLAIWLGFFAILLQFAAGSVSAVHHAQRLGGQPSAMKGVQLVEVCTPAGFQVLRLDADGNPLPADDGSAAVTGCPLCLLAGTPPVAMAPALGLVSAPPVLGPPPGRVAPVARVQAHRLPASRAPPASSRYA